MVRWQLMSLFLSYFNDYKDAGAAAQHQLTVIIFTDSVDWINTCWRNQLRLDNFLHVMFCLLNHSVSFCSLSLMLHAHLLQVLVFKPASQRKERPMTTRAKVKCSKKRSKWKTEDKWAMTEKRRHLKRPDLERKKQNRTGMNAEKPTHSYMIHRERQRQRQVKSSPLLCVDVMWSLIGL